MRTYQVQPSAMKIRPKTIASGCSIPNTTNSDSLSSRATTFLLKAVETGPRRSKKLEAGGYCSPGSLAFHFPRFKYLMETGMHNNGYKCCQQRLSILTVDTCFHLRGELVPAGRNCYQFWVLRAWKRLARKRTEKIGQDQG